MEAVKKPAAEPNDTNGAAPSEENPLSRVIGGFADDPLWDKFIEEMEQSRRESDRLRGLIERNLDVLENGIA